MAIRGMIRPAIPIFFGLFGFFTPFSIAGAHVSLALAVVCVLLDADSRRRVFGLFTSRPLGLPLLAWCLVSVISVVFAVDPGTSAVKLKKLALIPLIGIGALPIVRSHLRSILGVLLGSAIITSVWGLFEHVRDGGGLANRLDGIHGGYMTVGGILMVTGLLAVAELISACKDPRVRRVTFLSGAGASILTALVATYSRGSWLGFLAGMGVMLRRRWGIFGLLLVLAGTFVLLGPESIRDRAASIVDPEHPLNEVRVATWKHGFRMVADRPFTGTGLVIPNRLLEEGAFVGHDGTTIVPHSHMHNSYLQIAVSMGVPALLVFGWLIVAFFRIGRKAARSPIRNLWEEGLVAAYPAVLAALLVNGLVEWNFGDSEILGLFYFLTGAVRGLDRP